MNNPQVEKFVKNVDSYMAKYPSLTQYGKFSHSSVQTRWPVMALLCLRYALCLVKVCL